MDNNNNIRAGFTTLSYNKVVLIKQYLYIYVYMYINNIRLAYQHNILAMQRNIVLFAQFVCKSNVDVSYNSNQRIA